jgi:hypothetical protein
VLRLLSSVLHRVGMTLEMLPSSCHAALTSLIILTQAVVELDDYATSLMVDEIASTSVGWT